MDSCFLYTYAIQCWFKNLNPVLQVQMDVTPMTSTNFWALAIGMFGFGFKNSVIHKVVPGVMCQVL